MANPKKLTLQQRFNQLKDINDKQVKQINDQSLRIRELQKECEQLQEIKDWLGDEHPGWESEIKGWTEEGDLIEEVIQIRTRDEAKRFLQHNDLI